MRGKALERLSVNIPTEEWKSFFFFAVELSLQRLFSFSIVLHLKELI